MPFKGRMTRLEARGGGRPRGCPVCAAWPRYVVVELDDDGNPKPGKGQRICPHCGFEQFIMKTLQGVDVERV